MRTAVCWDSGQVRSLALAGPRGAAPGAEGNAGAPPPLTGFHGRARMKNPWMSMWLSAANRYGSAARGFWAAEAQRQQKAAAKAWTEAATGAGRRPPAKKGRKKV